MHADTITLTATQMRQAAAALRRQAELLEDSAQTMLHRACDYESRAAEMEAVPPDRG